MFQVDGLAVEQHDIHSKWRAALLGFTYWLFDRATSHLQILPKDTTREQLLQTMQAFTQALGVQCSYCHVQEGRGGRNDMASDEKRTKLAAVPSGSSPDLISPEEARPSLSPSVVMAVMAWHQKRA